MSIHDDAAGYTVVAFMILWLLFYLYAGWRFIQKKMSIEEMLRSHYLADKDNQ
jgi:hypothetical protein